MGIEEQSKGSSTVAELNEMREKTMKLIDAVNKTYMEAMEQKSIAVANLRKYEEQLRKEPFAGMEEEHIEKIRQVRAQEMICDNLQDKLYGLIHEADEYTRKMLDAIAEERAASFKELKSFVWDSMKDGWEGLKKGLTDLRDMFAEKNNQYINGNKNILLTVGTEANERYGHILQLLQQQANYFKNNVKTIFAERAVDARRMAEELRKPLVNGIEKAKEKEKITHIMNLADSLEKAKQKQQEMSKKNNGRSVLRNVLYNLALDRTKKLTSDLIAFGEQEIQRRTEHGKEGVQVGNSDMIQKMVDDAKKTRTLLEQEIPATYRMTER